MCGIFAVLFGAAALAQDVPQSLPPAQSFAPATNQTFYLDLDTAAGAYSQWRHDDLGSLSGMRATIRVLRIREDARWAPDFSLWLQDTATGKEQHRLAVRFFAHRQRTPLTAEVAQIERGKLVSSEKLNTTIGLNESVAVQIDWATPHSVRIKIGDSETRRVDVPWSINNAGISVSTGELEVDPLVFGSISQ
jgi:hypothetical protein